MGAAGRDWLMGFLLAPRAETMSTTCPESSQSSGEISIADRPQTSVTDTRRGLPGDVEVAGTSAAAVVGAVSMVQKATDGASLVCTLVAAAASSSSNPNPPVSGASLTGASGLSPAGCDVEAVEPPLSLLSCGRTFLTAAWNRFLPLATITSAPSSPGSRSTCSGTAAGPLPGHSDEVGFLLSARAATASVAAPPASPVADSAIASWHRAGDGSVN
mmetsp:Transcript_36781/g.88450  ORF Transcript_36781/g.88450 Transcript_36781/m.88450 type:complete len:216 (+) Transcript_36781:980-1627(+)